MRLALFIILSGIISFCQGQNWQTVNSKRVSHFAKKDGATTLYESLAIDSVVVDGTDSLLFNFRTYYANDAYLNCSQLNDTSWVGIYVRIDTNGLNYFYSKFGDTFMINTLADSGDSWNFSNTISASVTNKIWGSVAGSLFDSIKTIMLSNGTEIKISKNNGLIKTIRFGYYPISDTLLELRSIVRKSIWQAPSDSSIYNFNIGDEFHYNSYFYDDTWEWKIRHIIDKQNNNGEVVYLVRDCIKQCDYNGCAFIDTSLNITYTYNDSPHKSYSVIVNEGGYELFYHDTGLGGRKKLFKYTGYWYEPNDSCWWLIADGDFAYLWAEGLGQIYSSNYWNGSNLVYYNKFNEEEWGTSLGTCETLTKPELIANQVTIQPNPATDQLIISVEGKKLKAEIYNNMGQHIQSVNIQSSAQLNISQWETGIYFIKLLNEQGEYLGIKRIVKEK